MQKTAIKTAKPSPINGNALPVGNHPGNTGGKKGRSGRPPQAFSRFLARLRTDPDFHDALERAAKDDKGRNFASALKTLADYDDEKPSAKQQVDGRVQIVVRVIQEGRRFGA